jgi:hypothetical protein
MLIRREIAERHSRTRHLNPGCTSGLRTGKRRLFHNQKTGARTCSGIEEAVPIDIHTTTGHEHITRRHLTGIMLYGTERAEGFSMTSTHVDA